MNINGKEKVKIGFLLHKEELDLLPKRMRLPDREEKKVPKLSVHPLSTRETWKAAQEVDVERKELEAMKRKANEALKPPHGAVLKNPENNHMRIELDWDMRNKSRATYQAKIILDNGLIRAEVWGTKAGKLALSSEPLTMNLMWTDWMRKGVSN